MAHMLRKYTSNRGSALFMVISTMTALIISCMAMYFSMVSARSSQYTVFNQMQATQSAVSLRDIVSRGIMNSDNHAADPAAKKLFDEMLTLNIGESITTDANDFASLDPSNSSATRPDESQLGAYSVTITRMPDDANGNKVFDIMVITSVEGSRDAVHYVITYLPPAASTGGGGEAELFAATGYVPNDAYIDGGYYLTDVFYDTQYTYMNAFGGSGENRIGYNLSTGGDLMLGPDAMSVVHSASGDAISSEDVGKIGPVTWAIRGNFYPYLGSDMGVRGGTIFLVGGDFVGPNSNVGFNINNNGYNGPVDMNAEENKHVCIYVNGDYYGGGNDLRTNTWLFVNGNVYNVGGNAQSNARIYLTSNGSMQCSTSTPVYDWPIDGSFADGMTYNEAMELLGQKTQTIGYYKWDLSAETAAPGTQHIDIRTNATNSAWTDDKGTTYAAGENTYIISYDNNTTTAPLLKQNGGKENGVVGKSFIIDSVYTHGDQDHEQTIIIDTGDNPDNIITIKVSDVTGNGEFSWFVDSEEVWWPVHETKFGTPSGLMNGNRKRSVLVYGRGTVLIDVPNGVTYQDAGNQFTGHVGWWMIECAAEGGAGITYDGNGHIHFEGVNPQGKYASKIVPYIHKVCGETGDHCSFSNFTSTYLCETCGKEMTGIKCTIHGNVGKYCWDCTPEKASRTDWCRNHVDNENFKTFYNTLSGNNKAAVTGKDGNIVYPTTNFMVVSCDESAEMRFSVMKNGTEIVHNTLFGFIYAPYISYLSSGSTQAGGLIKLVGGMTVGDYDIKAIHAYMGCYPDRMPNEIAGLPGGGSMSGALGGTAKSWKFEIGGYR